MTSSAGTPAPAPTPTTSQQLARFAAELTYDELPGEVVQHLKLCLLDTLGCGLYGSTLPWTRILLDTITGVDGGGPCTVWGSGTRLSQPHAALVNGTAVHGFELDDLHPRSIVHPGSVVAPAAFAVAAEPLGRDVRVSGQDLLVALAAGYEVAARAGSTMGSAHLLAGWHPTGTHGTLGAAAAAGSALRLDPSEMAHALGTAGSQASGLMAAQFGAMVKRLHAGHASQSGVYAARLAQRGFTGIADLFSDGYGGYLSTFSPRSDERWLTAGLGSTWEILNVGFKPYSTNGSCHASIDALLDLRRREGVRAADVASVDIRCSSATYHHVGWRYVPDSVTTAQMNLSYIVAVVLTDGDAFVDQFTPDRITDPDLVELASRVGVTPDSQIDACGDAARHHTHLELRLHDGRVLTADRQYARGSARSPLQPEEVVDKFHRLAARAVGSERAEEIRRLVDQLERLDDLRPLTESLAADPAGLREP